MIEVNLFSVSAADPKAKFGRCVSRSRFNQELLGVGVMGFVKTFMAENLDVLQKALISKELIDLINSDKNLTTKDFMSVQYYLGQIGYHITIWNVADDEENATGVPDGDILEYNIIDNTFIQNDYPTVTKYMPAPGSSLVDVLETIIPQTGLFEKDRFAGLKNPFTDLLNALKSEQKTSGNINANIVSRIYQVLDQTGFEIFCGASEI